MLLRVTGRRELSTLEPFDLILIVVIGDLVQQGVTQSDMSFTGLVLAVGTFTILAVATRGSASASRRCGESSRRRRSWSSSTESPSSTTCAPSG